MPLRLFTFQQAGDAVNIGGQIGSMTKYGLLGGALVATSMVAIFFYKKTTELQNKIDKLRDEHLSEMKLQLAAALAKGA